MFVRDFGLNHTVTGLPRPWYSPTWVAEWCLPLVFKRRGGVVSRRLVRRLASLKMLVVDSLLRRIAPTGRVVGVLPRG